MSKKICIFLNHYFEVNICHSELFLKKKFPEEFSVFQDLPYFKDSLKVKSNK